MQQQPMATEPWWANHPDIIAVQEAAREEVQSWLDLPDDVEPSGESDQIIHDVWSGNSKRQLATARDDLAGARKRYDEAVLNARSMGLSWQEIGALLGVSRQVLHRRYAGISPASRGHTP
jgi:DNA-directed RNA polymerase specialized sigma24 family protein